MNRLRGGQDVYAGGQPVQRDIRMDHERLLADERSFAERAGERLSEAELRFRGQRRARKQEYDRLYRLANVDFWGGALDAVEGFLDPRNRLPAAAAGAGMGMSVAGPGGALVGAAAGATIGGALGGLERINRYSSDDYKIAPIAVEGGIRGQPGEEYWGVRSSA